jgi:membrane-anchored protein YejM (alkaline phosphatase superfamily)
LSFLIQISISIAIQILIGVYFLADIFLTFNTPITPTDHFYFIIYSFGIFLIIRTFLFFPYQVLKKIKPIIAGIFLSLCESLLIFLSIIDNIVFFNQGLHFYDSHVLQFLTNPNWNRETQLTWNVWVSLVSIFLVLFIFQLGLFKILQERLSRPIIKKVTIPSTIAVGLFLTLSNVYGHQFYFPKKGEILSSFPFYNIIYDSPGQEPLEEEYKYPEKKIQNAENKHIFLLMAESLRADVFTPELMPLLSEFVKKNGCFVSPKHYSGGHTTEHGVFTSLFGLNGYHFQNFRAKRLPSAGLKTLKDNNFEILGGSASSLRSFNGMGFIFDIFDDFQEFLGHEVYHDDLDMVNWALENIDQKKSQFMFLFFNSTHHHYYYPPEFEIYRPVVEKDFNHLKIAGKPQIKQQFFNKYKNSVRYVDHLLAKFLREAQEKDNKNSIIAIAGDHGEEFWEEGYLGHSKTNFINPRIQVPFIICDLQKKLATDKVKLTSHVDIMPTILNLLSLNIDWSNYFNGGDALTPRDNSYAVVTPPLFPYKKNKICLITKDKKYWFKKSSKKLHQLKPYKVTDLEDNIVKMSLKEEQEILKKFERDAYRFLSPAL